VGRQTLGAAAQLSEERTPNRRSGRPIQESAIYGDTSTLTKIPIRECDGDNSLQLKKPRVLEKEFCRPVRVSRFFGALWRFGNDERRSTWHLTPLRFFRMVSQSRTSVQKACKKATSGIPPQTNYNSSSRERASAVCSTRDTTCPPSPTPPRSSPRRRASRPAPPRFAPRPPRAPPRAAPSWSAPRTRRRVRRADISPVVNPSGPRAREAALAAFARSRTGPSPRRDRSARVPPQAASARARRRPGPASGRFHRVVLFADGITFSNHAQVPSP
jgi:hypothetical protein